MLTVTMVRKVDKSGYRLHISPEMANYPENECEAAAFINKVIETEIMRAPEQYLWMHRRFKTRPHGEASLYLMWRKVSFAKKLTFQSPVITLSNCLFLPSLNVYLLRSEIKLSPFHDTRKLRKVFKMPLVTLILGVH